MTAGGEELAERCAAISLLLVDVDGVLTDGVIAIDDRGVETKHFHVRDGTALALWRKLGRPAAILSGRKAEAVEHRARELGIAPVIQGVGDKGEPFRGLIRDLGIEAKQVCYVGDDLADLPVLLAAGLAACPSDAATEVREAAHLVLGTPGGRGAVREVVEVILKHQGLWDDLVARQRIPA
jgi:3-deoxy-D-manno-octulosonate 8-phosphate phosphatase (KDO 8-P phosphatase)